MTGNRVLLDTNIVIELFRGDTSVLSFLQHHQNVCITVVVLAELYLGAYRSTGIEKKLQQIDGFLERCLVLSSDHGTAQYYAAIKTALLNKGRPIHENDIWIAAIALQHNLPLCTTDKHFNEIDGISLM